MPECTPGQQIACACFDGATGAQRCGADGTFAACSCSGDASGSGSGATGGTRSAQGTGGTPSSVTGVGGTGAALSTGGSNTGAGSGGSTSGSGGGAGSGSSESSDGRRLPLPCSPPLPTGYCLVSDQGDYIGEGKSSQASGKSSVSVSAFSSNDLVELTLQNASTGDDFTADFAPPKGELLEPGLYDGATRYPFQLESVPGLSIYGNGSGCNELTGKFAVEELERDPMLGLVSFSVTFEQHCEGATPALRGAVNFQATGNPDPTPTPQKSIALNGKIFRVVYDAAANVAYGLDATNRRLAKIDLASSEGTYVDVVQVPNDGCLDPARGRLFVVNKGSSLVTEYDTKDLSSVRDIAWTGTDWGPDATEFKIYCTPDRVYVVDGAWAPGLFSIDGLDGKEPVVSDHSMEIAGVGGLVVNQAQTDLYYWYQYGWDAGLLNTADLDG